MEQYFKNKCCISIREQELLATKKVCVIGCGGLGGYILETLARIGVGSITVIDGDVFDRTNFNRQLFSAENLIGKSKVKIARKRLHDVNPEVSVNSVYEYLNEENAMQLLSGHDVIVDALDSIDIRMILQSAAKRLDVPMVHGAVAGWYGQVTTIFPGDDTLNKLYKNSTDKNSGKKIGTLSFTPAVVGSIQSSEVIKLLLGRGGILNNKVLFIDLFEQDYEIVPM